MIKLVQKQRAVRPVKNVFHIVASGNERGKLQPDITVEIIIISYFTPAYSLNSIQAPLFIARRTFLGSWLMKCPAAFLKSRKGFLEDFINENFIIWKYKHFALNPLMRVIAAQVSIYNLPEFVSVSLCVAVNIRARAL